MPTTRFDIAIIGAGPAGLCAAHRICNLGSMPSVVLIDKTQPWEGPIACAEGVGRLGFTEVLSPVKQWIRSQVSKASFHSPDNTIVTYYDANKGYIIDRNRMQKDLADACRQRGVNCLLHHRVAAVTEPDPSGRREIIFADLTKLQAQVVIDCSGPLSKFGRQEQLPWKPLDLEAAYFALINGVDIETDAVHIYMHSSMAPSGYAWAFPRDATSVNVGIVLGSRVAKPVNIRKLLDEFITLHFPKGKIAQRFAGTIPCYRTRQAMAVPGLLKAGDAASTINPISRAGIVEAMMSGGLAGEKAVAMLGAADLRGMQRICNAYEKAWFEKRGKRHQKLAKVKNELAAITDAEFDNAAHTLARVPQQELTMSKIFRISLGRFPKLVWAMRHLM